jgi:N-acyl-phosphatidylethanolamine-hydrolysing phospholipase D
MSTGMASAVLYACTSSQPASLGAVPEDSGTKPHHLKDGKGFANPWDSWQEMNAPQIMGAMLWRKLTGRLKFPDTTPPTVTVREPTFLESRQCSQALRATWLGHACYYVEFPNGLRVLFDPVFEDRCSPFSFMGPKRYTEAPCQLEDIPTIDVVIISHSHYDHLSHPSIHRIQKKHPNVLFAVPLGLKKWFHESGVSNVAELDWWQDIDITLSPAASTTEGKRISVTSSTNSTGHANGHQSPPPPSSAPSASDAITARISCLPCQHTSARTALDRNTTLWASWAVAAGGKSVWFGGDTGYRAVPDLPKDADDYGPEYAHLPRCPAFAQIGKLRGPFDLGLIPIGAYDPRYIMSSMHANPFDSVEIFKETRCRKAMGIHWGTWALTVEDVLEPPVLLKEALKRSGIAETGVFDICDIGESREF